MSVHFFHTPLNKKTIRLYNISHSKSNETRLHLGKQFRQVWLQLLHSTNRLPAEKYSLAQSLCWGTLSLGWTGGMHIPAPHWKFYHKAYGRLMFISTRKRKHKTWTVHILHLNLLNSHFTRKARTSWTVWLWLNLPTIRPPSGNRICTWVTGSPSTSFTASWAFFTDSLSKK